MKNILDKSTGKSKISFSLFQKDGLDFFFFFTCIEPQWIFSLVLNSTFVFSAILPTLFTLSVFQTPLKLVETLPLNLVNFYQKHVSVSLLLLKSKEIRKATCGIRDCSLQETEKPVLILCCLLSYLRGCLLYKDVSVLPACALVLHEPSILIFVLMSDK